MADPSRAVFVSYASQDTDEARNICLALRAAGIEVWFDQSELRGGEAWDVSIRRQIKGCKLFLPIISRNTQAREEGYFRREWNLAVGRTLDRAEDAAFLLPVVIDTTSDADARVPEKFREVQWTRLVDGKTSADFVERVRLLTSKNTSAYYSSPTSAAQLIADVGVKRRIREQPRPTTESNRIFNAAFRLLKPGIPILVLMIAGFLVIQSWQKKEHARNVLLPEIQSTAQAIFRSNRQLFDKATEVEKLLPNEPILAKWWPSIANSLSIETDPVAAEVFWKDYDTPDADWRFAGVTPFKDVKVPRDFLRLEIRKMGYQTIELADPSFSLRIPPIVERLKMDRLGSLPENMVRIPTGMTEIALIGLDSYKPREVPEFLIDRFEVTNKKFKAFIDAGGYTNAAYWTIPILDGTRVLSLKAAMAMFTDRTGRLGPATWEAGTYPDGAENHPVTGVSWYEASAYATWAHKELPTVFHWSTVADTSRSEFLLPLSNLASKSTTNVGSVAGFSTYGIYDLAGNAREWTSNRSSGSDQYFILGGGWNDHWYAFNDSFAQPGLDRGESNGFRCIQELPGKSTAAALQEPISAIFRDYTKEKPVDKATFATFARQFLYDKTPLNSRIERTIENDSWRDEVVSIDAGYNNERLLVHVLLPKQFTERLQPVIYFPGSGALYASKFDPTSVDNRVLFLIKSGRALIFPIFKGTYERQDDLRSPYAVESVLYKDHIIMWGKEISRAVDYLETRGDMRADKIAYFGFSWGGRLGGTFPAIEKRIRVVVLNVGGMGMGRALPEVDEINYLPEVTQPVLMLNAKYDMFFPVETSQKPMFRFLGTAPDQKKMVIYGSGHLVPPTELIKESLAWLDTYLGPVR